MKLYDMKLAPNPRRVRIFLAEKGIYVERVDLNIGAGENLSPEFLAINPRGLLPTLVLDDGTVLDESIAICRYFEEVYPEPNLMGRTALEKAMIESWQRRIEFDGLLSVATAFRNAAPHFANRSMPGAHPPLPQVPAMVERGMILSQGFFDALNDRLGNSAYVAGDRFTIADITALTTIDFAKWIKLTIGEQHPHLRRWYADVSARPSATA